MSTLITLVVYCVFASQIFLISFYLPIQWRKRRRAMFEAYPEAEYPKLYLQPVAVEYQRLTVRKYLDLGIGGLGIALISYVWLSSQSLEQIARIMFFYSISQLIPRIVSGYWGFKNTGLARRQPPLANRKAALVARKITDFISPLYLGFAGVMYCLTLVMGIVIYIGDLWTGKIWAIFAMLALSTLISGAIVVLIYNNLYGKPNDRYLVYTDRLKRMGLMTNRLTFISILYSFFVIGLYFTKLFQLGHIVVYVLTSIYLQVILFLSTCNTSERDYSVYKVD